MKYIEDCKARARRRLQQPAGGTGAGHGQRTAAVASAVLGRKRLLRSRQGILCQLMQALLVREDRRPAARDCRRACLPCQDCRHVTDHTDKGRVQCPCLSAGVPRYCIWQGPGSQCAVRACSERARLLVLRHSAAASGCWPGWHAWPQASGAGLGRRHWPVPWPTGTQRGRGFMRVWQPKIYHDAWRQGLGTAGDRLLPFLPACTTAPSWSAAAAWRQPTKPRLPSLNCFPA